VDIQKNWEAKNLANPDCLYDIYFNKILLSEEVDLEFAKLVARGPWEEFDWVFDKYDLVNEFKKTKVDIGNKLKLKLILTGLSNNLPLIPSLAYFQAEYGFTHAALQVGPWLVDWNQGELVVPRPMLSSHLHMVLDLESTIDLNEENLKKVCKVISFWNNKIHYNMLAGDHSKITCFGNCHAFVDYLLNQFEGQFTRWRPDGPIEQLIDDIKWQPSNYEMRVPDHGSFKTHEELCTYFKEKIATAEGIDPELLRIFKALDRKCRFETTESETPVMSSSLQILSSSLVDTNNRPTVSGDGILLKGGIFGGLEGYGEECSRVFDLLVLEEY